MSKFQHNSRDMYYSIRTLSEFTLYSYLGDENGQENDHHAIALVSLPVKMLPVKVKN